MKNTNTFTRFALIFFAFFGLISSFLLAPLSAAAAVSIGGSTSTDYPVWISAPSIKLSSPIQSVGVTTDGAMAVPSGKSDNVGWYNRGVIPGSTGTAVLDAHVFAAFKTLAYAKAGSSIYITMHSGKVLHFVVTKAKTYAISNLSPSTLFAPTLARQVNLITCAGSLTPDHTTYDHRLIVSAQLV